jgi:hypothetical protein
MADVAESAKYHDVVFSQARRWVDVSKSDTVNFTELPKAIYVGGAGVVVALGSDDVACSFTAVAGQILPIRPKRINSTNTTATLMVALY